LPEPRRDAGRESDEPPASTVCPDCHAVFEHGRWCWGAVPTEAGRRRCPACRRLLEHAPAGVVALGGSFLRIHRDEIMACVRHLCDRAYVEHPLERLMEIDEDDDVITIMTTSAHLARGIGRALKEAWDGELDLDANAGDAPRVTWRR
jgi:hypothetical protein